MKVIVIMACLNIMRYLHNVGNSVYAQTYSDWEIII
jgi:glycosyltransferase involved in cell wall biosynthesis